MIKNFKKIAILATATILMINPKILMHRLLKRRKCTLV